MKISPLNKYYFDKSYIVDKHDPNHDKRRNHALITEKQCFAPLNATYTSFKKKHPFLRVFLVAHVYALIPDCPSPGPIAPNHTLQKQCSHFFLRYLSFSFIYFVYVCCCHGYRVFLVLALPCKCSSNRDKSILHGGDILQPCSFR